MARNKKMRFFYLNGELHKTLRINRSDDTIETWAYPSHRRVSYSYSDVKKNMERAWTTIEVANMLRRDKMTLYRAIQSGELERPQMTYSLDTGNEGRVLWSEKDIMAMHDVLATHHTGKERKDGKITVQKAVSKQELRAMIRQNIVLYVKTDDGFVPTWNAEQF